MTDSQITICGHGSDTPSLKNMSEYCTNRYNKTADNGKRKGLVAVRRLNGFNATAMQTFVDSYGVILGRNEYDQNRREYVFNAYSNGTYYSDCSSSGCACYMKAGFNTGYLNTAGIYESSMFQTVPVQIVDGHVVNPEILQVGDALLFVGNDPKRPLQIGHVEYVYSMNAGGYSGGAVTSTVGGNNSGLYTPDGMPYESGYGAGYGYGEDSTNGMTDGGLISKLTGFVTTISNTAKKLSNVFSTFKDVAEALSDRLRNGFLTSTFEVVYEAVAAEIEKDELKTADEYNTELGGTSLLTYPSLVEAPYIIVTIGEYKFGSYSKRNINSSLNINYPNYIHGMTVTKINGQVNQYSINMTYQIEYGQDPNLLDRIFSTVGYGVIKISYGDWASPTFIYREEEAIITNLSSSVDFASAKIDYTLKCTSNALVLAGGYFDFEKINAKPSDRIKEILYDPQYGLQEVFAGMASKTKVNSMNLIASDDRTVEIEAKHGIDALSYINYLVSCMCSNSNSEENPIKDSTYMMSIHDDTYGEEGLNGSYFKVTKVSTSAKTLATADVYEVDVGFPTDTLVMGFRVLNDNSWALLYNYSDKINSSEYMYSIDNNGNLITQYSPAIATSASSFKMTEAQKTWWTNMTQFPIQAELTIKGLVRPALLMTYIRINALFYGQRHVSSGLYIITKQVDTINNNGYRTNLTLLRIGGDNDYIVKTKTQVTSNLPVAVVVKEHVQNEDTPTLAEVTANSRNEGKKSGGLSDAISLMKNLYEAGGAEATNFYNYQGGTGFTDSSIGQLGQYTGQAQNQSLNQTSYSGAGANGPIKGQGYDIRDNEILAICAGCLQEQGGYLPAIAWEASLLANLTDKYGKGKSPYEFMLGNWFASSTHRAMKDKAYLGSSVNGNILTEEVVNTVIDVLVRGNRQTQATEHDCISDLKQLDVNGRIIESGSINKNDSTQWIPNVTIVYNKYGSIWRFVGFPGGNTKCDPFGIKTGDWK